MQEFTIIDGACALVRAKHGVYRQSPVFKRGDHNYIPHGRGFVRLTCRLGGQWYTSNSSLIVLELEGV